MTHLQRLFLFFFTKSLSKPLKVLVQYRDPILYKKFRSYFLKSYPVYKHKYFNGFRMTDQILLKESIFLFMLRLKKKYKQKNKV